MQNFEKIFIHVFSASICNTGWCPLSPDEWKVLRHLTPDGEKLTSPISCRKSWNISPLQRHHFHESKVSPIKRCWWLHVLDEYRTSAIMRRKWKSTNVTSSISWNRAFLHWFGQIWFLNVGQMSYMKMFYFRVLKKFNSGTATLRTPKYLNYMMRD